MEIIVEIILGRFIIRFLGVNVRYFVLKIFNTSLKKADLHGTKGDHGSTFANDLINAIVGFCVFFALFYFWGIIYDWLYPLVLCVFKVLACNTASNKKTWLVRFLEPQRTILLDSVERVNV